MQDRVSRAIWVNCNIAIRLILFGSIPQNIYATYPIFFELFVEIFIFGTLAACNQYVMPLDFDYQMFQNFNVMSFTNAIIFASLLIIRLTNIIMVSQVKR